MPVSRLVRFTPAERRIHRLTSGLMLICMATAVALYNPGVATLVGSRYVVATLHLYSGFALPIPMLFGLASKAFRKDVSLLNRFAGYDKQWLRKKGREVHGLTVGKFNAGQKLNAAFTVGATYVMLGTGIIMYYPHVAQIAWRTGATFVHDMLALAIFIVVGGHVWKAGNDPEARRGMRTGSVDKQWAEAQHSAWAAEHAD